ncbi:MAG: high frequency lysogenization protein HflD [Proteobacteria bacterium]|nr:high frequency lysogenization protein HflD [Pseudomonadota bacterium]MDA1302155.1 high frequency lysogenization protein HflD [Pseudomonadota bacterium]
MTGSWEDRVLALAGVTQAAHLVGSAARTGMVSQNSLEACLDSIFVVNPEEPVDVYGGIKGVSIGLRILEEMLVQRQYVEHTDVLRYGLALLRLEKQLSARSDVLAALGLRIREVDEHRRVTDPPVLSDPVITELASLYENHIGQLSPRIQIMGQRQHLQNAFNVTRIRALLLAGMRSAVLWRQLGGRQWQLIFSRRKLTGALNYIRNIQKHQ